MEERRRPRSYTPSGKYPRSVLFAPVLVIPVAALSAWASATMAPQEHLYVFVGALFEATIVGGSAGLLLRWFRSRSPLLNRVIAGTLAAVSIYLGWAFYLRKLALPQPPLMFVLDPVSVANVFLDHGAAAPVGYRVAWIGSALLQGGTVLFWTAWIPTGPFCERCQSWFGKMEELFRLAPTSERPDRQLRRWDLEALASQQLYDPEKHAGFYVFSGRLCDCKEIGAVALGRQEGRRGRISLVAPLLVSRKEFRRLKGVPARIRGEVLPG